MRHNALLSFTVQFYLILLKFEFLKYIKIENSYFTILPFF